MLDFLGLIGLRGRCKMVKGVLLRKNRNTACIVDLLQHKEVCMWNWCFFWIDLFCYLLALPIKIFFKVFIFALEKLGKRFLESK